MASDRGVNSDTFRRVFHPESDVARRIAEYDDEELPDMCVRGDRICEYLDELDGGFETSLASPPGNSMAVREWYQKVAHTVCVLYVLDWMLKDSIWVRNNGYEMGINLEWDFGWDYTNKDERWCKLSPALVKAAVAARGKELRINGDDRSDLTEDVLMAACRMLLQPVLTEERGCIILKENADELQDYEKLLNAADELQIWRARLRDGLRPEGMHPPDIDSPVCVNAMRCTARAMNGLAWSISLKARRAKHVGYVCDGRTYRVQGVLWLRLGERELFSRRLQESFDSVCPSDQRDTYDENSYTPPEDWRDRLDY
jgi:hypothetical protein